MGRMKQLSYCLAAAAGLLGIAAAGLLAQTVPVAAPAKTTLAAAYAAGSGQVVLASGTGGLIAPSPSGGTPGPFIMTSPTGTVGVFQCTGRTGDTLTGVTAIDGTSDQFFPAGSTVARGVAAGGGGGGGTPGGSNGQVQINSSGAFGGITIGGDATLNAGTGALTVSKTGGVAFAASATTDTTVASNIATGTMAAARLPTTGLTLTQYAGAIATDADGATVTFDLSQSNWHQVQIAGNRTLAVSNPTVGQQFNVVIQQDASGTSRTVTWFSGILWPGGTIPVLTVGASKRDVFTFKCISSGVYLGFIAGQNM